MATAKDLVATAKTAVASDAAADRTLADASAAKQAALDGKAASSAAVADVFATLDHRLPEATPFDAMNGDVVIKIDGHTQILPLGDLASLDPVIPAPAVPASSATS